MKPITVAKVVILGIVVAALLRYRPVSDANAETANLLLPESGMRARILSYPLIDAASGKVVKLSDFQGKAKAIYIDVFASWCGPCQSFLPDVKDLNKKLKDKGVLVLGLNIADSWNAMQRDIRENGLTYTVLHDDGKGGGVASLLGADTIPTIIVLDGKTMEQKARWIGGDDASKRDKVLASLGVDLGHE